MPQRALEVIENKPTPMLSGGAQERNEFFHPIPQWYSRLFKTFARFTGGIVLVQDTHFNGDTPVNEKVRRDVSIGLIFDICVSTMSEELSDVRLRLVHKLYLDNQREGKRA